MKTSGICGLVVWALALSAPLEASAQETLVLGTIQSPTSPETLAAEHFAEQIAERTEGRYSIRVVSSAQLGPALEQYQNVQSGAQDLFIDDIGWNAQLVRDFGVLAVPFLVPDAEAYAELLGGEIGQRWTNALREEHGLVTLSDQFLRSPRVVFTAEPVETAADMEEIRFRVPEIDVYFSSWEAIGVSPTPVPWGELYLALRQGVVEGGEGPFSTLLPNRFVEPAPHVLETNHLYSSNTLIMQADRFEALGEEDQQHFTAAAIAAADFYNDLVAELESEHRGSMQTEYGVTFRVPTDDARAVFQERARAAIPALEGQGLWSEGLYDEVANALQ